ncbi:MULTISPECIES: aldose epimerase family protein [Vibrio]|uniref:aldose epimerase family protein n=1 Tax=Vibrio TaxID=662 RepID=UPI000619E955|nr:MULTISPECIES: aldose epimerase family protein [Vibrio]
MSVSEHSVERKHWGDYNIFVLTNNNGVTVEISDLGATIVSFWVTDKSSIPRNIVLGYDTANEYLSGGAFIGAVVGPWGNRIDNGKYELNGQTVQLDKNEGENHLHGGSCTLHKRRWEVMASAKQGISLQTRVASGEGGYPANLTLLVTYRLSDDNELSIDYHVTADKECPVNPTHHAYFNLSGQHKSIGDHVVSIDADRYWQVDKNSIPTIQASVGTSAMSFMTPKKVGLGLSSADTNLVETKGYDHCYIVNGEGLRHFAWVFEATTGIELDVFSDRPAIQFYTGNHLAGESRKTNELFVQYAGLCLETQAFPNQVNMPEYQDGGLVHPNNPFFSTTIYKVSVDNL